MLSKSQYLKYLQCPKAFWLYRKDKSKLTPPSPLQQQIFDTGTEVGEVAWGLFPGGRLIPFNITNIPGMARQTRTAITNSTDTIYEASFIVDKLFVAVDILHREEDSWHLYEVKSSTGVKDTYIDDAAVQCYVLEKSGIKLTSMNIVHINNRYVLDGELDLKQLFSILDVTDEARLRVAEIPLRIDEMKSILAGPEPHRPIGPHCLSPYECDAKDYCWKTLAGVPENSVFTLTTANPERKFDLYKSGIANIADVPPEDCTMAQQLQIQGELHIEPDPIREFVRDLVYPITHLDFESFQSAVPQYQGTQAYTQIPFQYSLHIEENPGNLLHKEFLGPIGTDPRRELAEQLLADIPEEGTILTYNQKFEKSIIGKLAKAFPDLKTPLLALNERVRDLMLPFQKRWYYHPAQNGSYSIKKVLPALVPEMDEAYKNLPGVNNGGEASSTWSALPRNADPNQVEQIRSELLAYCRLDTHAMVKILDVLRQV
ncbi:MAG: DUF2779 domain-containing protein [Spirochaetaceae bacterium]|nr:DUF2779 domain-containing protein [Spirochaetaceae bacterium]